MDRAREVMKNLWADQWSKEIYGVQPYRVDTTHYQEWFKVIKTHLPKRPLHVLEFGCGAGHRWHALNQVLNISYYVGIDYSPMQLDQFRSQAPGAQSAILDKKLHLVEFDLAELPFDDVDNAYDLVFTAGTLMHLYSHNCIRVLKECFRLSSNWIMHLEENKYQAADILNGYDLKHLYKQADPRNRAIVYYNENFIHQATEGYHPNVNLTGEKARSSQLILVNNQETEYPEEMELQWLDYHMDLGRRKMRRTFKT